MSKVNTLFSYFQKTPAREKSSNSVGALCKTDDNANIQSSSDVKRGGSSACPKSKRSPAAKLSGVPSKKSTGKDRPARIGRILLNLYNNLILIPSQPGLLRNVLQFLFPLSLT